MWLAVDLLARDASWALFGVYFRAVDLTHHLTWRQRGKTGNPRQDPELRLLPVIERYHAFKMSVVKALEDEQVVGWFQGHMEFGPRALGGRSIIGDPRSKKMQSVMNLKIKYRESFRPFAPTVLAA